MRHWKFCDFQFLQPRSFSSPQKFKPPINLNHLTPSNSRFKYSSLPEVKKPFIDRGHQEIHLSWELSKLIRHVYVIFARCRPNKRTFPLPFFSCTNSRFCLLPLITSGRPVIVIQSNFCVNQHHDALFLIPLAQFETIFAIYEIVFRPPKNKNANNHAPLKDHNLGAVNERERVK